MKRFFVAALLGAAACGAAARAEAGSYLFERSYYSHTPVDPVQIGHRVPLGGPQFTRPLGFAVSSGYRLDRSQLRVRGQVVEQTNAWESWVQFHGKY